ncbi:MAG: hypothetical protein KKA73_16030 [Chloroflexi bacterium]|nr:hypothetical protein [Chloroflexota bacterium]
MMTQILPPGAKLVSWNTPDYWQVSIRDSNGDGKWFATPLGSWTPHDLALAVARMTAYSQADIEVRRMHCGRPVRSVRYGADAVVHQRFVVTMEWSGWNIQPLGAGAGA